MSDLVSPRYGRKSWYAVFGKRVFDVVVSALGLALLSPLILLVALLVRCRLGQPVVFRQQRGGRNESSFSVVKFRSMTDACDESGALLSDEERLTNFGRLIRRLRLDELLQLWNVLRGEIEFCIGPRPALVAYLDDYDVYQRRRLEARPGMTGWAQVNGNVQLTWDERILLDVWYIDHLSLWLDLRIIGATVGVVLFGEYPNEKALEEARQHALRAGWSS